MRKSMKMGVIALFCITLMGCSNAYAKSQYDSNEKITQMSDHYTKSNSVLNNHGDSITLTVEKFDGRETIWTKEYVMDQDVVLTVRFTIGRGKAKLVHIDADDNIEVIAECTADTSITEAMDYTVHMTEGKNRLKVVGYDCEDITLKIELQSVKEET